MITLTVVNLNIAFTKAPQAVKFSIITIIILIALPQLYAFGIVLEWIYKQDVFRKLLSRSQMRQSE